MTPVHRSTHRISVGTLPILPLVYDSAILETTHDCPLTQPRRSTKLFTLKVKVSGSATINPIQTTIRPITASTFGRIGRPGAQFQTGWKRERRSEAGRAYAVMQLYSHGPCRLCSLPDEVSCSGNVAGLTRSPRELRRFARERGRTCHGCDIRLTHSFDIKSRQNVMDP